MMFSSDLNVERFGGYDDHLAARQPLAEAVVRVALELSVMPRGMNAPKLWPAEPVNLNVIVSSGRPGGAVLAA